MFTRGLPAFAASTASGMNPPRNSGTVLPFNKGALPDADAKAHGTEIRCFLPTERRYTTHISTRLSLIRSPIADNLFLLLGSDQPTVCHLRGTFLKNASYNERLITACQLPNKSSRTILLRNVPLEKKYATGKMCLPGVDPRSNVRLTPCISGHLRFPKKGPRGKPWPGNGNDKANHSISRQCSTNWFRFQSLSWRPAFNTIGSEQRDLVWQPQLQLAHGISV